MKKYKYRVTCMNDSEILMKDLYFSDKKGGIKNEWFDCTLHT